MKVLLDSCVWGGAKETLLAAGHEVEWTGDWPQDPGDEQILNAAFNAGQVLITLDKDFGELAVVKGRQHRGIARLVNIRSADQGPLAVSVLSKYGVELAKGAIVTVELARIRIRVIDSSEN